MQQISLHDKLAYLVKNSGRNEAEIMAEAIDQGVTVLYQKYITSDYLAGKLNREQAVSVLGAAKVDELDRNRQYVERNIVW